MILTVMNAIYAIALQLILCNCFAIYAIALLSFAMTRLRLAVANAHTLSPAHVLSTTNKQIVLLGP